VSHNWSFIRVPSLTSIMLAKKSTPTVGSLIYKKNHKCHVERFESFPFYGSFEIVASQQPKARSKLIDTTTFHIRSSRRRHGLPRFCHILMWLLRTDYYTFNA
jgi:hypothetical protein